MSYSPDYDTTSRYAPLGGLPDPVQQPELYENTPVKRLFAWIIDLVVITALMVPAVVLTAFTGLFFLPFLFLVVGFIYRVATIAGGSATWGMRMMSVQLRNDRGERLSGGEALFHTLGYTVSVSIFPLQLISIVMMCITERRQGLTDSIMGTVALNRGR